jgi:hypothetical protein
MISNNLTIATSTVTRIVMPALRERILGAPVQGRRMAVGTSSYVFVRVPAIQKGAFPGVRAWSPPV